MTNKPIEKFQFGAVCAAVWENTNKANGKQITSMSVSVDRAYKDKDDNWKHTDFLGANDIPKAILALSAAYKYVLSAKKNPDDSDNASPEVVGSFQA